MKALIKNPENEKYEMALMADGSVGWAHWEGPFAVVSSVDEAHNLNARACGKFATQKYNIKLAEVSHG